MSNIIEAIIGRTLPVQRAGPPAQSEQLSVTWQTGLESGGLVQRKLRLTSANLLAPQSGR